MVALRLYSNDFLDAPKLDHPIDLDAIQVAFDYRVRGIKTVGGLKGRKVACILARPFTLKHIGIEYELDFRDDSIWTGRTCVWQTGARQVLQFCLIYESERMS